MGLGGSWLVAWTRLSTGTRKSELELIVLGPLPLNQTISAWPGNCAWKGGGDHLPPRALGPCHKTQDQTTRAASSMSKETSGGKPEVNGMLRRGCPGVAK
jgi:hypothetical protein